MKPQRGAALERRISANDAAVLGLLMDGVSSGYDLNKRIHGSVGFFWTPAKSHVYATLARLVDAGLATARAVPQETRPDKQLYRVTPRGRRAFLDWLANAPLEPARFKNSFLLKIFFGRHMSREALVTHVERKRAWALAYLDEYRGIEEEIRDEEPSYFGYVTLRWGIAHAEAWVRWADEILAELEGRP